MSSQPTRGRRAPPSTPFTEAMRDRQARGKDPEESSDEFESDREGFRAVEQRRIAAQVLSDPELLLMYALSRQDSIPGTRLHFTRILCGYEEEGPQKLRRR
ncbi:hypothetical protein VUR80DRAFT_3458 [Thermomyces stellatus]